MTGLNINANNISFAQIMQSAENVADGKVTIDDQGNVTANNKSRRILGIFSRKKVIADINAKTEKSIRILHNALRNSFGNKGIKAFNEFISQRKIEGKQRITKNDLIAIQNQLNPTRPNTNQTNANTNQTNANSNVVTLRQVVQNGNNQSFHSEGISFVNQCATSLSMLLNNQTLNLSQDDKDNLNTVNRQINGIIDEFKDYKIGSKYGAQDLEELVDAIITKANALRNTVGIIINRANMGGNQNISNQIIQYFSRIQQGIGNLVTTYKQKQNLLEEAIVNNGNSFKNVKDAYCNKLRASMNMVDKLWTQVNSKHTDRRQLNHIKNVLTNLKNSYQNKIDNFIQIAQQANENDPVPKKYLKEFKKMQETSAKEINATIKKLQKDYGANYLDKVKNNDLMEEYSNILGKDAKWGNTIEKSMQLDVDGQRKNFKSVMTPVTQFNRNVYQNNQNNQNNQIHNQQEAPVYGIPSGNRTSGHVSNMFRTEIKNDQGRTLFSAYRHAVLDASKEKVGAQREAKSKQRTTEMLVSIIKDRYSNIANSGNSSDNPITFNLMSVNLMNGTNIGGNEYDMIEHQTNALKSFMPKDEAGNQIPVKLEIDGKEVYIKPNIITFNTPANKYSTKALIGNWIWSNGSKATDNVGSFNQLFGDTYLNKNSQYKINEITSNNQEYVNDFYNDFYRRMGPDSLVGKFLLDENVSQADKNKVCILSAEINLLMQNGNYRDSKFDAFELPARLVLLSNILNKDNVTCFNCKSGKDRTGHLDIVAKQLAIKMDTVKNGTNIVQFLQNKSSIVSTMTGQENVTKKDDNQNFKELSINSGNLEVQKLNCGLMGSKVHKVTGIVNHFGDKDMFQFYQGASKFAKS